MIDSSPGLFVADASGQGAIINQDRTPNSVHNGAEPDSVVSIFATGEGQTDPAGEDGVLNGLTLPLPKPHLPVTVEIDGKPAEVTYYGAAPGQVAGLLQVNARVPADVPRGKSVPVTITVGAATSQAGVTLYIKWGGGPPPPPHPHQRLRLGGAKLLATFPPRPPPLPIRK